MLRDGLAEGLTLLGIADGRVESGLRHAHGSRRYVDAPGFQAAHHLPEADALRLAYQVVGGNGVVVEVQLHGVQAAVAQLVQITAHLEPGTRFAPLHHEGAQPPVARLHFPVGAGQQAEHIAVAPVGDEHLGAVDDIFLAVLRGRGLQVSHVGAAARLRQRQPAPLLAGGQVGQEPLLLLLGAVVGQRIGQDVMGADSSAETHQPHAQFLEDAGEGGIVQPQPAILLRHGDAEQPQLLHLVNEVMRHPVLPVQLGGHRLHLAPHEIAHQGHNLGTCLCGCCNHGLLLTDYFQRRDSRGILSRTRRSRRSLRLILMAGWPPPA